MRGHYIHVPIELATTPAEGHAYVNRWWSVHPERGLTFYVASLARLTFEGEPIEPSPQCNAVEETARLLAARTRPDDEVMFFPVVFAAHARKELVRLNSALKEPTP